MIDPVETQHNVDDLLYMYNNGFIRSLLDIIQKQSLRIERLEIQMIRNAKGRNYYDRNYQDRWIDIQEELK